MTLQDAKLLGYVETLTSWERGYVSRRTSSNPVDIRVYPGKGIRRGLLYYRKPSFRSTQFCIRQYLAKGVN